MASSLPSQLLLYLERLDGLLHTLRLSDFLNIEVEGLDHLVLHSVLHVCGDWKIGLVIGGSIWLLWFVELSVM